MGYLLIALIASLESEGTISIETITKFKNDNKTKHPNIIVSLVKKK